MNNANQQLLLSCEKLAQTVAENDICQIVTQMKQATEAEHLPTIALVSVMKDKASLLGLASKLLNQTPPTEALQNDSDAAELFIELVKAKKCRLLLFSGLAEPEEWEGRLEEADIVCLCINATMAMTHSEKDWLKNYLLPYFGEEHFSVLINHIMVLNNDQEREAVQANVEQTVNMMGLFGTPYLCIASAQNGLLTELSHLDGVNVRDRRILRNGIRRINQLLTEKLDAFTTDGSTADNAIGQLKKQQQRLTLAGQVTADSTVVNAFIKLRSSLEEAIADYASQAEAHVLTLIEETPDDKLESLTSVVCSYLESVWQHFTQQTGIKLDQELESLFATLMRQMETDAGSLFAELDKAAMEVIRKAMKLNNMPDISSSPVCSPTEDYSLDGMKRDVRNLMLLSVALAFVNPLYGVVSFAGSQLFSELKKNQVRSNFRQTLKDSVTECCEQTRQLLSKSMSDALDQSMQDSADKVRKAYSNLIDLLVGQIDQMIQKQTNVQAHIAVLKEAYQTQMPVLLQLSR